MTMKRYELFLENYQICEFNHIFYDILDLLGHLTRIVEDL